jgi:hypothetical protein
MPHTPNYQIITGPSKWDLMMVTFENTSERHRNVYFELTPNDARRRVIFESDSVAVRPESGDGESWLIEAWSTDRKTVLTGFYSTKRRTGGGALKPFDS